MRRIVLALAMLGIFGGPLVCHGQLLKPPKLEKMIKTPKLQHKKPPPGQFYIGKPQCCC